MWILCHCFLNPDIFDEEKVLAVFESITPSRWFSSNFVSSLQMLPLYRSAFCSLLAMTSESLMLGHPVVQIWSGPGVGVWSYFCWTIWKNRSLWGFFSLFWEDWQHLFRIKQHFYLDLFTVMWRLHVQTKCYTQDLVHSQKGSMFSYSKEFNLSVTEFLEV